MRAEVSSAGGAHAGRSSPRPPPAPPPRLSLPLHRFTLGLRRGGQRPTLDLLLNASGVSPGVTFSALLHLDSQHLTPSQTTLEREPFPSESAALHLRFEVASPGEGLLAVTSHPLAGEGHTETFHISVMPENPYIVGPPIHNPRDFYGREQEVELLLRELETNAVALLGEVRMGKSSLLNQLEHQLGGSCQLLSVQRYAAELEALPLRMAELIAPGISLEGERWRVLDRAISARLEELSRSRGPGTRFTLLIDEAQLLVGSATLRHELRALFQARQRHGLRVLVAGPPQAMRELAHDPDGSPFLNMFLTHRLGPMERDEVERLLRTPLGDEYTVTDEAVTRVVALSGGGRSSHSYWATTP